MDRFSQSKQLLIWRLVLAATLLLSTLALLQGAKLIQQRGLLVLSSKWMLLLALGLMGLTAELALLVTSWTRLQRTFFHFLESSFRFLQRLRAFNLFLFGLLIALYSFLLLGPYGRHLEYVDIRQFLFWCVLLSGAVLIKAAGFDRSWTELLVASLLLTALGYRIAAFLPDISTHPFTLGWSEASRYYYASLYFSDQVYGLRVPPTVLHPSRYLLQAVPFLIPDSPLWLHRIWQVFLWVGITLVTAVLLARRLAIPDRFHRLLLVAWAFLFLLLGAVYYHLQIPLILVLWGFESSRAPGQRGWIDNRFVKSLFVVLLASAWAGISRVNWFPVPGMLAAALYLLEQPVAGQTLPSAAKPNSQRSGGATPFLPWGYLIKPFMLVVLGSLTAFAAQSLYMLWSGNEASHFTSSFSSDLLWYRLLPNPTYPPGILLSILLVSLPLICLLFSGISGRWRSFHPLRLLGLAAILLVLFAGGLVVSVKIGGGGDLHNLDAYLALLLVIATSIYFGRFLEDLPVAPREPQSTWLHLAAHAAASTNFLQRKALVALALASAILLPAYFAIRSGGSLRTPNPVNTQAALQTIREYTDTANGAGGEVLFLGERQLLTFQYLDGVRLVPDYERVFLMEMAMAGNREYLGRLHGELKAQRYALIVSEPLIIKYKGRAESFGEENDAWVNQVSKHVLCYYEPKETLREVRVQLLVPRSEIGNCP